MISRRSYIHMAIAKWGAYVLLADVVVMWDDSR